MAHAKPSTKAKLGTEITVQDVLPKAIAPQLATLASTVPSSGEWSYEIKFDGYRLLCRIEKGVASLFTKNGHDWSDRMPRIATALLEVPAQTLWIDGEVVVLNESGMPDFNALQNAFSSKRTTKLTYFAFDLLYLDGRDLRELPLFERRALLGGLLENVTHMAIRYSDDFAEDPHSLLDSACRMQLEGIMGNRIDASYRSGRSTSWIKLKCRRRQEFVVGGFTRTAGAKTGIRSLMVGVHERDGSLRYAGTVKAEMRPRQIAELGKQAAELITSDPAFYNPPPIEKARDFVWLRPDLVAEVSFMEWTAAGQIRHPSLHGMRADKAASDIREEIAIDVDTPEGVPSRSNRGTTTAATNKGSVAGIKITNADRIIDPSTGFQKIDLARYYDDIAEYALPYFQDRPVSLVRAPTGVNGDLFFQKYEERSKIPGITRLATNLYPGHPPLLVVDSREALVGLAQLGCIETHSWNAVQPDLDHPDRFILDLDPDPALPWQMMLDAATLAKVLLDEIGLQSFVKTSGGKGFHIVVPMTRRQGWSEIKAFSKAVAQHMAGLMPERFSAVLGPKNRVGKIFIDYLRNSKGASTAAAFTARARPGMGVSMPIAWNELTEVKAADVWNIRNAVQRWQSLERDPWEGYHRTRQGITPAMRRAIGMK